MNTIRLTKLIKGHWFNWRRAEARRRYRGQVVLWAAEHYLPRFLPGEVPQEEVVRNDGGEKIFALWFQGEEQAPELVKACLRSMRRHNPDKELVVLDERTMLDYINLPAVIVDKWRAGTIGHANFSDMVRLDLLHNHGGYWFDATCFSTAPIPQFVVDADIFMYLAGTVTPHTLIQTCFIRARKGDALLAAWRQAMINYWSRENKALDYFVCHLLLKELVRHNPRAAELFAKMPQIDQDPTHVLWYGDRATAPYTPEEFAELTGGAFFQKTSYREAFGRTPPPGSMAEYIVRS